MCIRDRYSERFERILDDWTEICEMVPEEWKHFDGSDSVATDFSFEEALECLKQYEQDSFWTEHD